MRKMALLFSHKLNQQQIDDAIESYDIDEFVYLDDEMQSIFSNIPADIENIADYLIALQIFLLDNLKKSDVVLIQGDYGITYNMVNFAKYMGYIPVYATTKRESIECIVDGKTIKQSIFKHVKFREYR